MTTHPEEFEELVSRYSRVIASAARKVCGRRYGHLLPDVEQEVRLALWKHLRGGKKIAHPVSYLYKVGLTTALALIRREGAAVDPLEAEQAPEPVDVRDRQELQAGERAQLLRQVLSTLPEEQARALRAYLAGFGHKEIAVLHGWTEATARHRLYRGIEALKRRFGGDS